MIYQAKLGRAVFATLKSNNPGQVIKWGIDTITAELGGHYMGNVELGGSVSLFFRDKTGERVLDIVPVVSPVDN